MGFFHDNALIGASGAGGAAAYQIDRSVRLNSADSAHFSRTPSSAGNRKTWTWSGWVKRSYLNSNGATYQQVFTAGTSSASRDVFFFDTDTDDTLAFFSSNGFSAGVLLFRTDAVFRDPSAWYHVVLSVDTTQATAANRIKLYVNGIEQSFSTANYPAQNSDGLINSTNDHAIGRDEGQDDEYFDGYLADVHFIDGQALAATDFGEYDADTGVWNPIRYSGSYGTNGFKLDFSDNTSTTTIAEDSSGNNNDWTANNISVTAGADNDSLVDSPTNGTQTDTGAGGEVSGCYPTWNPLSGQHQELLNGNLKAESGTISSYATIPSTIAMTSGKWYAEFKYVENINADGDGSSFFRFGISQTDRDFESGSDPLGTAKDFGFTGAGTLRARTNGSNTYTYTGNTVADGDILSLAFDADAGKLWIARNGTWATNSGGTGDPANGNNPDYSSLTYSGGYVFVAGPYAGAASPAQGGGRLSAKLIANWGQRSFIYSAPSGFKALNTASMSAATIADGSTAFDAVTYTGNGGTQTISGLDFSPDLVWMKSRSSAFHHQLYDTIRGVNKPVFSSLTDAEFTDTDALTSFNSNGWTLGAEAAVNSNGATYVGWAWDAGSSTVSNTDGSITSSVRANASAGFSIVSYTADGTNGTSVGHNLGAKPALVIQKDRTSASDWLVLTQLIDGSNDYLLLNSTAAAAAAAAGMTSTTFGSWNRTNGNSIIAYCFAPVEGYSAFGSYDGNGSTDGPFVYTGFRPKWIMVKRTDSGSAWTIMDTERGAFNAVDERLTANSSSAELTDQPVDFLSNGFKHRNTGLNVTSSSWVYAAFAEHPFKTARAR